MADHHQDARLQRGATGGLTPDYPDATAGLRDGLASRASGAGGQPPGSGVQIRFAVRHGAPLELNRDVIDPK
jgi:hypothetical protein